MPSIDRRKPQTSLPSGTHTKVRAVCIKQNMHACTHAACTPLTPSQRRQKYLPDAPHSRRKLWSRRSSAALSSRNRVIFLPYPAYLPTGWARLTLHDLSLYSSGSSARWPRVRWSGASRHSCRAIMSSLDDGEVGVAPSACAGSVPQRSLSAAAVHTWRSGFARRNERGDDERMPGSLRSARACEGGRTALRGWPIWKTNGAS